MEHSTRWEPKLGKGVVISMWLGIAFIVGILVALAASANAADAAKSEVFDVKNLLLVLIPSLWASMGPVIMAMLTKTVNSTVGAYVPRPLQVIVSSILGGLAASMADGGATVAATALAGGASQVYAGVQPATLLTEKKRD